jgi:hypothetical protein
VPDNLALLIENGAIDGEWELFINGVSVERDAFSAIEYHGADKIACSVAHLFQRGKNTLALRVGAAPLWGGLRTPLHLLGDFALGGTDNRTLVSLPDTSRFNDLVAAGFPHFSGAVTYRKVLPSSAFAGYTAIALPAGFTDIAQVKVGDVVLGVRAWSPYQWKLPVERGETIALEIEVTNTLLPFVEGQIWHVQTQKPHKV